ncbi:type III secretion effector protein [Pseudomonas fluorescens]|nr:MULTISPECIES: type III secretion effector protein [Pseudomonas]MBT2339712.1 type III secretion effector protein [Pseudomonas fluorescens]
MPALDPVNEGALDELRDRLVAVQEEALPQGVLDLVVSLFRLQLPVLENGRKAPPPVKARLDGVCDEHRPTVRDTASPALRQPMLSATSPQRLEPLAAAVEQAAAPACPVSVEPTPLEPVIGRGAALDEPPAQVPLSPAGTRHAPPAAPASTRSAPVPPPLPLFDIALEVSPTPERGLLHVPFHNGAASGQVTISRVPEESPRSFTLSPSNALVFEQLKEPFAQAREPAWRLTESGGEQSRQGSRQAPDDDQDEASEHPA